MPSHIGVKIGSRSRPFCTRLDLFTYSSRICHISFTFGRYAEADWGKRKLVMSAGGGSDPLKQDGLWSSLRRRGKKVLWLKSCPRCHEGDLLLEQDLYG